MKPMVLASQSPRRKELLRRLIPEFTVMAVHSPETLIPGEEPLAAVQRLAAEKAAGAAARLQGDALVLAADTVVALGGNILGKPKDRQEAFAMLSALAGRTHWVCTGLALQDSGTGKRVADAVRTQVRFRPLTPAEIWAYIDTGEPMDKAGAYGIQELGALLVEEIQGDYFNVVGLPLCRLGKILKEEYAVDLLTGHRG